MAKKSDQIALRVATIYGGATTAYILGSDWLLAKLFPRANDISYFQTIKGLGFVLITAAILYLVLRSILRRGERESDERRRAQAQLDNKKQVWKMIASGEPLEEILSTLLRFVEDESKELVGSILLLDEDGLHLRHGAAPSLAPQLIAAVQGLKVGPSSGCCGTAVFRREPVVVSDVASDPLMRDFREILGAHRLRACWSTPIFDTQKQVLGACAVYFRTPAIPTRQQKELIDFITHTAAIAIARQREVETLRKNDKLIQRAQAIARLGRWTADVQQGVFHTTAEGGALIGWPAGVQKLEKIFEIIHPADITRMQAAWQATLTNGVPYDIEHRIVRHGETRWIHARGEPELDLRGRTLRVIGITQDITERKEAEAALQLSEQRYRLLTEQAADAFFIHDETGRLLEVNRRTCESLGYTRQELLQLRVLDIEKDFDQEALTQLLRQLQPGQARTVIGLHQRKNGSRFPVEIRIGSFEADGHRMFHALCRDITERKRAADALEMFRTLVDRVNDAIEVIDPDTGRFLDINEKACADLGYAREELLSLSVLDIDPGMDLATFKANKEKLWDTGALITESNRRRKDGTLFPVEVNMKWVWLDRDYMVAVVRDISERKRTEAALHASEAKYRSMVATLAEGILLLDLDGRITTCNPSAERILGRRHEALLGQPFMDADWQTITEDGTPFPDDQHPAVVALRTAISQGNVLMGLRRTDGSVTWISINANPVLGLDDGQVKGVVCSFADITERRAAEAALRRSEQQYASLVNNIDGVVWEANVHTFETGFVSSQAQHILGYAVQDWTSSKSFWRDHLHPEDRDRVLTFRADQVAQGTSHDDEYRMISATGLEVWIHDYVTVETEHRKAIKLRGIMVDITQRKETEAKLRKNEELFRSLIEHASDLITVVNQEGRIQFQSPSSEKITGYKPEVLAGQTLYSIVQPDDAPRIRKAIDQALAIPGMPIPSEYRFRHQNGEWRTVQAIAKSIPGQTPTELVVVVNSRDITDTRKLEEQFRQSQKMEAIGQLAGGVAHDLNNILTVVHMQLDLLKHGDPLTPIQLESILDIEKASRRAADLTRQLLMFSRRQAAQKTNLDLNAVVTNITKMLQRILGEDIGMHLSYAPQPLPVLADQGMMEQILLNLAVNSRDAMPSGGRLVIESSVVEIDEFAASQRPQSRPGRFACLSVSDTGHGIPKEILPRIFEPFFTTKDVGKGTGLGLATVFGILQQHNGWINAYSEMGHGSVFRMYLPLQNIAADGETERLPAGVMRGGPETILLVEDEQSLRVLTRNVLTRLGYHVLEATTGVTALDVWKQHREQIKLLLTDLVMPDGMTGKQLAEELIKQDPHLKVVYTSGYSRDIAGQNFPLQDGVNFLSKPFQASKLAQVVRSRLDS